MRKSLGAITIFTFLIQSMFLPLARVSHAADLGKKLSLGVVSGMDVARYFALRCADETFKEFAAWAKKNKFTSQDITVGDGTLVIRGNSFVAGNSELKVLSHDKFEFRHEGKSFKGADLCDIFMQTAKAEGANASFYFFTKAWADDNDGKSTAGKALAWLSVAAGLVGAGLAGAAAAGAVTLTAPVWGGIALAVGAGFLGYRYLTSDGPKPKDLLASILKEAPSPLCDPYSTTFQTKDYKVYINKRYIDRPRLTIYDLRNGKSSTVVSDSDVDGTVPYRLAMAFAEKCKSNQDADAMEKGLKSAIARANTNLALVESAKVPAAPAKTPGAK